MNKLKRIVFALFIALSLILGLSACRDKVKVEFDQASYTIKEGFEQKVPMHLTGVKFDNKDLVVESSEPSVFTVVLIDGFAKVTAVAPGTATLKILYKQKEMASVEIKVIAREDLRVESLSIDLDTELNIEVGVSEDVPITLNNIVYNDPDLTITSSNQLVATAVIKEGFITVTGVAVGTATLTLKKGDAVDTLVVNVSEGEVVIPDDETLVTFIVEVPMDTINEVYVVTNLNNFDVENGILLTKNADGKYEGSKSMKIGYELKYKYVNGKSWDYVEKLADGSEMEDDRSVTITDGMAPITDTVALWAGDIPPAQNVNVTFSVEVPADTEHVYIAGSFNNWNETDPIEMVKDAETGKFAVVLELEVGQEVEYKYLNGKDWDHVEKDAEGEEIGNRLLTPDAETTTVNDVVATWNLPDVVLGDPVTFKIIVTVPETTGDNQVHLISNLDDWSAANAHLLTKNEVTGKYEIELTHPENTVFKFKFVLNASWDRVEVDANGNNITDRQLTVVADMQPSEYEVLRWKEIVDPSTEVTVRVEVAVPAETPADAEVYLISDLDEWQEANARKLTPLENGNFEIELSLAENSVFKFKFVLNGLWANVEQDANGQDIDDRSFTVTADLVLEPFAVARWKGIEVPAADVSVKFEVSVPAETPADANVYLVGSMVEWVLADAHLLTKNGETGKYEVTITLKDKTTYEYKYVIGNTDYSNVELQTNGEDVQNRTLAVTEATTLVENAVARWKGIDPITEPTKVIVRVEVAVPAETPADAEVYLISDLDEWQEANARKLTLLENGNFEIELSLAENSVFKFKFVLNGLWANVEQDANGQDIDNRTFTVTADLVLEPFAVARWKGIEVPAADVSVKFEVSVPAETPADANVYLVGSMVEWVLADAYLLTKNGETGKYEVTITLKDKTTYEYKYVIGNTDYSNVELQTNGEDVQNRTLAVTETTTLVENTVARWKGIEVPVEEQEVTFLLTVPVETIAPVCLVHDYDGNFDLTKAWTLTSKGENLFELKVTLPVGTVLQYKYTLNFAWTNVEMQADGVTDVDNRSITVTKDMAAVENTVARWKGIEPPVETYQVTFEVTLPAMPSEAEAYLIGVFPGLEPEVTPVEDNTVANQWHNFSVDYKLVLEGTVYKLTLNEVPKDYELKYKVMYKLGDKVVEETKVEPRVNTITAATNITINDVVWQPQLGDPVNVKFVVKAVPEGTTQVLLLGNFEHDTPNYYWDPANGYELQLVGTNYELTIELPYGYELEYKFHNGEEFEVYTNNRNFTVGEVVETDDSITAWEVSNMVQNPNFASGMDNWATFTGAGAATYTPDGENGLKVEVTTVGASYEPRLSQMGIAFEKGKSYRISFDAKALAEKTINLQVGQLIDWEPYFINFINGWIVHREVGLEWNTLSFEFTMNHENPNGGIVLEFGTVGESAVTTTLWIRNVEVVEIDLLPVVNETVKFEVTVPEYTTGEVALVHNLVGWDALNGLVLTKNSETGKYEGQMDIQVGMTLEYKYVLNKNWANVEVQADGVSDISNRVLNITSGMVQTLDTVLRWKGIEPPAPKVTTHFVLTVPAGTPSDAVIYIIGELPGLENVHPEPPTQPTHAWGNFTDDYKLVRGEDGKYRISIESEPNFYLRYNYYIVMGDNNIREIGAVRTHTAVATNTLNDEVTKWEEPVTITFSVTVPEGTPASASVYVIGVFKELIYPGMGVNPTQLNHQWNNFTNKYKMTKGEGNVYTLSLVIDYNYTFFYKYVYTVDNIDRFWETGDNRSYTALETKTYNDEVTAWNPAPAKYTVTFSVTVPAVPEGANVYMIGVFPGLLWLGDLGEGEEATVNHQWNNFSDTYKMTKGEGNVYTLNVEAPVNFTLIYKYAILTSSNDRVWEVHDNREYVVTAAGTQNDVVNSWDEIPTTDKMVLISVAAPAGTENVYFVGNVTEPTPWDFSNPVPLTYNSVSGKFEIEAPFAVGYVLEYKFVCGPHWAFVEVDGLGGDISNRQTTIQEETTSIEATVAGWKNVYDPDGANVVVEFIVTVPAGTTGDVYLVGINGWDLADGIKLTKNNDTGKYEGNVTLQSGHAYEYKFVNGTTWETGANRVLVPTSDQTEQADTVNAWSS